PALRHPFFPALDSGACFPRSNLIFTNRWRAGRPGIRSPEALEGGSAAAGRWRLGSGPGSQGRRVNIRLGVRLGLGGGRIRIRQHTRHPQSSSALISLPLRACVPLARFPAERWSLPGSAPAPAPPCPLLTSEKRVKTWF